MENSDLLIHEPFIQKCLELAISSGKKGNHTFGAVLVYQGKMIDSAENTEVNGQGFGHAEYNLLMQSIAAFPEEMLRECILYTSTFPCPRCMCAILALGIPEVVYSVSSEAFARLVPGEFRPLNWGAIFQQMGLRVELNGPIMEEQGMRVFEYWDGKSISLESLLEFAKKARIKEDE